MSDFKVLILDYSVDKTEAFYTKQWIPSEFDVKSLSVDSEDSFPIDLAGKDAFTHIIHTGSALSITERTPFTNRAVKFIQSMCDDGIPQMGICYGAQLLCLALVGEHAVRSSPNGLEAGWGDVKFINGAKGLLATNETETVWQHHFDEIIELPEGSDILATNEHTEIQAFINLEQKLLGTQFHPEFDKKSGDKLFIDDKDCLQRNGYELEALLSRGPSFDVGHVFFDFFFEFQPCSKGLS